MSSFRVLIRALSWLLASAPKRVQSALELLSKSPVMCCSSLGFGSDATSGGLGLTGLFAAARLCSRLINEISIVQELESTHKFVHQPGFDLLRLASDYRS